MMEAMQAQGVEGGEDYRLAAADGLKSILSGLEPVIMSVPAGPEAPTHTLMFPALAHPGLALESLSVAIIGACRRYTSKLSITASAIARLVTTPTTSRTLGLPAPRKTMAAPPRRRFRRASARLKRSVSRQRMAGLSTNRSTSMVGWRHASRQRPERG